MKICYLFSDGRKTGPADLIMLMARALGERGHDVTIAYAGRSKSDAMRRAIEQSGLKGTDRFALDRYLSPVGTIRDLIQLPRYFADESFDVVHTNLRHDQTVGVLAARRCSKARRPIVVHSVYERLGPKNSLLRRRLFRMADGVVVFTADFRSKLIERFALPPQCVAVVPPPIDTAAFAGPRPEARRRVRAELGLADDVPLIGMASRLQPYRRVDVFLEAARRVLKAEPHARFIVLGRSSRREQSFLTPRRELGLEDHVIAAGYRRDDYADYLAAMDIFTLLMPGSDGTARAVREAMALGCACVVSDFGMLPELVPHEQGGMVSSFDPDSLATTWGTLIRNPAHRRQLAAAGSAYALERFCPQRCAEALEQCYARLTRQRGD